MFYTRIPKTGSMTFRTLLEHLSVTNGFVDNTAHMKINVPMILQSKDKRVRLLIISNIYILYTLFFKDYIKKFSYFV